MASAAYRALLCLAVVSLVQHAAAQSEPSTIVTYGESVPDDTIRIIALGTGTPSVTKEQAGTSYLLLLGNASRPILLDAGTGSYTNLLTTGVSLGLRKFWIVWLNPDETRKMNIDSFTQVFLSHLHSDHITDLAPLYAIANGRKNPLGIWGPSGAVPATGTKALVQGLRAFLGWDQAARNHVSQFPPGYRGNQVEAHEFDYSKKNQLIYSKDGLKVYSNPAFHYDTPGATSLRVEWRGIKVAYSGDTIPLETFVDFARGSDVIIHESVGPIYSFNFQLPPVSTNILTNHTNQQEVGAVFQATQPRLAVASHLNVNAYSVVPIITAIRETFPSGPLAIAKDLTVWDVSPNAVTEKQFVYAPGNWGYIFSPEQRTPGYTQPIGASPVQPDGKLATRNDRLDPRPAVVQPGNLRVLHIPGDGSSSATPTSAAADSSG